METKGILPKRIDFLFLTGDEFHTPAVVLNSFVSPTFHAAYGASLIRPTRASPFL